MAVKYRRAMQRLVLAGALVAGACGSAADDRPPTLDFITETILAPSCAVAQCHSAFRREIGDQFDTPEATRRSIVANQLVVAEDQTDPAGAYLVRSLTVGVQSLLDPDRGLVRMPYDAPLPDADIDLIERWIGDGFPGAQCVANDLGRGCSSVEVAGARVYSVVECSGGNIGAVVTVCPAGQICTFYSGNGRCVAP